MEEYDVLGGYVPVFLEHLADTRARLGLGVGPSAHEDPNITPDVLREGATNSEVDDFSDWTRAERDAFFRGLSVYSRWRPDLIAACVPTKSEWEVWMFSEALEEGAARLAAGWDLEMHVDASVSGSDSTDQDTDEDMDEDTDEDKGEDMDEDTDDDTDEDRDDYAGDSEGQVVCKPALEVSQAWIDVEEEMAAWIIREEERLASGGGDRVQAHNSGKARAQSIGQGQVGSDDDDCTSPSKSAHRDVRNTSTSTTQQREVMGHLKMPHLLALARILRDDEEATHITNKGRERSEALAQHEEQGKASSSSNIVIGSVLSTLSGDVDPAGQQLVRDPSESTLIPTQASSSLLDGLSQSTSLGVSSRPPLQLDCTSANQVVNVESDLSLLSPQSRRRMQKRLYMRRKRAMLVGNIVDTGMAKKAESKQGKTSVMSTPAPCSEGHSEAEMEPNERPKAKKGRRTLPSKLKSLFSELGIDAAYLRGQGMDLLNLNTLGRLIRLYGDEEDGSNTVQSVDAELVRHLQAGVLSFVTDVIHRAIVWREREVRMKQRCRAWRVGGQININAIEHAVDVIGARYRSHREYFQSLEGLDSLPTEFSSPDPDDGTDFELMYSLHREAYTPLVHPPSAWRMGSLVSLTRRYEQEATRSRRDSSAGVDEEDLMADETDEEALAAEMREEEELDAADMKASVAEEGASLNRLKVT